MNKVQFEDDLEKGFEEYHKYREKWKEEFSG